MFLPERVTYFKKDLSINKRVDILVLKFML